MKRFIIIISMLLFAISLNAKTIWIFDYTDDRFSKFYNQYWDGLKYTKYGDFCKYVTSENEIHEKRKIGDAVIVINGIHIERSNEDIQFYNINFCTITSNYSWNYSGNFIGAATWQYISDQAISAKNRTINFLNDNFIVD